MKIKQEIPEVNLARRLIERQNLVPPVDILYLSRLYARVEILEMPSGFDGVSLHLKRKGKRPHIIVNSTMSKTRIRFTLAHELGHVIIPWHIGSIVDWIDIPFFAEDIYWYYEREANRFAAELLMPESWILSIIGKHDNPCDKMQEVAAVAKVSLQAAALRIASCTSEPCLFVMLEGNKVKLGGRSPSALARVPRSGEEIDPRKLFPWNRHHWHKKDGEFVYHWWSFTGSADQIAAPVEDWRSVLDEIVSDLPIPESNHRQFKMRVNGVIANANGSVRQARSVESVYEACLQRLYSNAREDELYKMLVESRKFKLFLSSRVHALVPAP